MRRTLLCTVIAGFGILEGLQVKKMGQQISSRKRNLIDDFSDTTAKQTVAQNDKGYIQVSLCRFGRT